MNVADLIHKLSKLPSHAKVCVGRGGRGSWRRVEEMTSVTMGALIEFPSEGLAVIEREVDEDEEEAVVLGAGLPLHWKGAVL